MQKLLIKILKNTFYKIIEKNFLYRYNFICTKEEEYIWKEKEAFH